MINVMINLKKQIQNRIVGQNNAWVKISFELRRHIQRQVWDKVYHQVKDRVMNKIIHKMDNT